MLNSMGLTGFQWNLKLKIIFTLYLIIGSIYCDNCQIAMTYTYYIEGPNNTNEFECWIRAMKDWRIFEKKAVNYSDSNYHKPEIKWSQRNPIQPQMMAHDRDFYDPISMQYTVEKYVNRLKERYGGIDSVLVWPTYPNIGIDNRNTDDLIRDMPGGVTGIRKMIEDFHKFNVKVLFPIHPWDIGTRDPGNDWSVVLPKTMAEINADGLNGDTMASVNREYFDNSVVNKHTLVLEPEMGLFNESMKSVEYNLLDWDEIWDPYSFRPRIRRNKWFEPKHQQHICQRWSKSKINILQSAFFNGIGFESWENVWGIWNQMTDRDCTAIKIVAEILREFHYLFVSEEWVPYYNTCKEGVFASKWSINTSLNLFTLINRNDKNLTGDQIEVDFDKSYNYYDLWHGRKLEPKIIGNKAVLDFMIEAQGFGAIIYFNQNDLPKNFSSFLSKMQNYTKHSLSYYSASNLIQTQTVIPIKGTKPYDKPPEGMVSIPSANYTFKVSGNEIEGGNDAGVDFQYVWEQFPQRSHNHIIGLKKFFIDKTPVTNKQFYEFLNSTQYKPKDNHNFLRDWNNGRYPNEWDNKPVTWVSLEDSREFCQWNGKRLPHEYEWQYSAQGLDGRLYPWGNTFDQNKVPKPVKGRIMGSPDSVNAHEDGSSPFDVIDLVGNVWQWTDEYIDDHTRAAVLRGGSYYLPSGSKWYFPNGENNYRLDIHNKYLLMSPSLDRSATIGFRCAADSL